MTKLEDVVWSRLSKLKNRDEQTWVRHDTRWLRGLFARAALIFVVGVFCDFYLQWGSPGWLYTLASVVIGMIVGRVAFTTIARAQAYRNGWIDGRGQSMISLAEAMRRGLSPQEWIVSQYEADMATLGATLVPLEQPKGHRLGGCEVCTAERQEYLESGGDPSVLDMMFHEAPPYEEDD